ncbi:hypothetical protein AAFF_G00187700 [Aldrovandia affinis]|uniref:CWF19-like protein 2 n=1 Tax=Aldrovandia affinis TaxID=143900 RepID=A0AAD7SY39_9TELE|nr:hypothetical protein AAFF_G00187700 [Aldrovandia affinis]
MHLRQQKNIIYGIIMAAIGQSFESKNSIEERKELKRQARENVLREAKEKYEREEKKKELKRARGEDTWMLPEVDLRLQQLDQEHSSTSKKKKEKKSKKNKKEKKKKVKKERKAAKEDDSSDSSEDSGDEWVEAQPQPEVLQKAWKIQNKKNPATASPTNTSKRDDWMTFDFLTMKTTSTTERRAEKEKQKEEEREKAQAIKQAGLHKLELNPFWKDGGSGLPPQKSFAAPPQRAGVVDDGGLSWLRKAYQRMREQAEREQRSLEAVVAERYGSLEQFQKRLAEAENAAYGRRREDRQPGAERWRRRGPEVSDRRFGRDREATPPTGSDDADQAWGRGEGRGARRDWNMDRGRGSRQRHDGARDDREGFLRPSEEEEEDGRARAWKRPSSREPEAAGHSAVRSAVPEGTPHTGPKDPKSQQQPKRETSAALEESHSSSSVVTSPRGSASPAQATESEEEEEEEEVQILTDEELNKLGAKLVKAELMGNMALVDKLKAQLEAARKAKESRAQNSPALAAASKVSGHAEVDQEVVLFRTDQAGRAWPVSAPTQLLEPRGGRRKKKAVETHRDGERVRYFQDDDGVNLQEMVRREKMSTAEDQNALYSRMAAKMMGKQDGDNYTLDDMFVSSAAQRERSGQDEERQRNKAIQEHRSWAGSMQKCLYCFDSQGLPKHLIIAIGIKVYLCLPNSVSLAEGHCLITPLQHHCAATGLDEDVWGEIQMFRKALVKMFEDQDQDCVFLETHMNPKKRQHMVYECVPLPKELGDMAPIYFKKALMESDEEWAMNKKVVDLSSRDIRRAIPKGLPYFSVDFGLQGGYAHVIENEQKFPHYFGKEIIGGMMDLEPRRWRKPMRENFDDQRKKVLQFAKWWKPFDCTKSDS